MVLRATFRQDRPRLTLATPSYSNVVKEDIPEIGRVLIDYLRYLVTLIITCIDCYITILIQYY